MKIYLSPSKQPHNLYAGQSVSEQTMCTRYAEACKAALERAGHSVILSPGLSLSSRMAEANRWGAALYVPIHTNAGGGRGVEVLVSGNGRANPYAQAICSALAEVIPSRTNRGLKVRGPGQAGWGEIGGANAPVAYVEAEFHDNRDYAAWLVANPVLVGETIARGIAAVAGGSVTPSTPSVPADNSGQIDEDGVRGPLTIGRWQWVMGTVQDRKITKLSKAPAHPLDYLIGRDQAFLNSVVASEHIRNLTGKPRLDEDAIEGKKTIKVRQFWLFNLYAQARLSRAPKASDFDGIAGRETTTLHQFALNRATEASGRY